MITNLVLEAFDWELCSPCQHLRKCMKNSMENMHSDIRMEKVKRKKR